MNSIRDFAQTLTHHPIWKLSNSVSTLDNQFFGGVMMSKTPQYKQKILSTLSQDKGVHELYTMINSRSVQNTSLQLAYCLNNASEGMMNNIKTDEGWKNIYLEVLSKKTSINRDCLRNYYQTYQKVMSDGYLNYYTMLDKAFERFEKSVYSKKT